MLSIICLILFGNILLFSIIIKHTVRPKFASFPILFKLLLFEIEYEIECNTYTQTCIHTYIPGTGK